MRLLDFIQVELAVEEKVLNIDRKRQLLIPLFFISMIFSLQSFTYPDCAPRKHVQESNYTSGTSCPKPRHWG